MDNETRIYTEVYTVLDRLPDEYTIKIPDHIKAAIYEKADTDYYYQINDMLPQSKAMIFEIIRKYFQNEEFNKKAEDYIDYCKKIDLMQNGVKEEYLQQTEFKNDIFSDNKNEYDNANKNLPMEIPKKSLWMKMVDYIKSIFKVKK